MNKQKSLNTGLTLTQLKVAFVGILIFFKLAPENNIKHWSWWWVTAPIWIFDAILLVVLGLLFIGTFVIHVINQIISRGDEDDRE